MATQTLSKPEQDSATEQKLQKLREAFADAPQMAKTALKNLAQGLATHREVYRRDRIGDQRGRLRDSILVDEWADGHTVLLRFVAKLVPLGRPLRPLLPDADRVA